MPEYEREKNPEWLIRVPPDLALSHPLVKAAAAALHRAAKHPTQSVRWAERYRANLVRAGDGCLDIAVSKPLIPRALRIMQALVSALEKRGYAVSINEKSETIVKVLGEDFQIALNERQKQVKVEHHHGTSIDLEPSGRLRLRIGPDYSSSGIADDPPRLIEDLLNRFVASLVRRAVEAKRQRAIQQERERRWRVHDDERRLRDQARHSEDLRRRRLRVLASRWVQHRRLSEFVSSVDRRILEAPLEGESREAATRWVEWAKENLTKTDPIDALLKEPWPTRTVAAADVDAVELGVKRRADRLDDVQGVVNIAPGLNVAAPFRCSAVRRGPAVISVPVARYAERTCGNLIRCRTLSRWPRPKN